jgi:hypothetical protein
MVVLEFKLRALDLLGRYSTAWAMCPALLYLVFSPTLLPSELSEDLYDSTLFPLIYYLQLF